MLCAFCIYTSWRYRMIQTSIAQDLAAWIVATLCLINGSPPADLLDGPIIIIIHPACSAGQYYMQVVVGNTHRKVPNYSC